MATEKVMISEQILQDTADSIRTKLNTEDKIKPVEFAEKIDGMNIAAPVEKGLVINAYDSNGYVTDASIIGMTIIPDNYCNGLMTSTNIYKNISDNLQLPSGLTKVGMNVFKNCDALTGIYLSETVVEVAWAAFDGSSIKNIQIPNSVTTMSYYVFQNCKKLENVIYSSGCSTLYTSMFYGCSALTSITNLDGVKSLDQQCFWACSSLESIELPIVEKIGKSAFINCSKLKKIILSRVTSVPTLDIYQTFDSTPIKSGTGYIYVPDTLVEDFKVATNWSTIATQIKGLSELEVSE